MCADYRHWGRPICNSWQTKTDNDDDYDDDDDDVQTIVV